MNLFWCVCGGIAAVCVVLGAWFLKSIASSLSNFEGLFRRYLANMEVIASATQQQAVVQSALSQFLVTNEKQRLAADAEGVRILRDLAERLGELLAVAEQIREADEAVEAGGGQKGARYRSGERTGMALRDMLLADPKIVHFEPRAFQDKHSADEHGVYALSLCFDAPGAADLRIEVFPELPLPVRISGLQVAYATEDYFSKNDLAAAVACVRKELSSRAAFPAHDFGRTLPGSTDPEATQREGRVLDAETLRLFGQLEAALVKHGGLLLRPVMACTWNLSAGQKNVEVIIRKDEKRPYLLRSRGFAEIAGLNSLEHDELEVAFDEAMLPEVVELLAWYLKGEGGTGAA
jgi:hypothetical protein